MKHRLLKELPFMAKGEVFGKGCWAGGGCGIDRGNNKHGVHNGVDTFGESENEILTAVMIREDWTKRIPEGVTDLFSLLDDGIIERSEQEQIANVIRKIDFANGNANDFLKHLAGALINR